MVRLQDPYIRLYGDTAIVLVREELKGASQGNPIQGQYRVTMVFVRQQGRWLLASMQFGPIAGAHP
ncbi:DUF4440 domain-containing protein [Thermosporothrix hazakensis]|jgi:ketosteroid isomerase-like protein|uniref:DUF4440 domain-containing protein n=1 Tax=Thermosporothrix hazakensis TaxID=644383 RepID=UPI0010D04EA5|nr:DUF4440 domain-containing protein [Thermosporothrix hazakensis]GCE51184.1 hypothetical protein KTH_60530 [Thermosporothrix hazakensis]